MAADPPHKILAPAEQVAYLRDAKGISFRLVDEASAEAFLADRNYLFKVKAFAKNFDKYADPAHGKGRYVNLDFGMLVELSRLDKELRALVLALTLDIEHCLRVRINAAAMRAGADPFGTVESFLAASRADVEASQVRELGPSSGEAVGRAAEALLAADPTDAESVVRAANYAVRELAEVTGGRNPMHVRDGIASMVRSPYSGELAKKYGGSTPPLWALTELVSFGTLIRLYGHCFGGGGAIADPAEHEAWRASRALLRCVQQLRNACAHNDCLLNSLATHTRRRGAHGAVRRELEARGIVGAEGLRQVSSVRFAMDLAATLLCYERYVPEGASRSAAASDCTRVSERLALHAEWFSRCYAVSSFLSYAGELLREFARLLA